MLLPWSIGEYTPLLPTDLDGSAPTPESRIRVAAAVATMIRDGNIIRGGKIVGGGPNAETVRCLLTMSDEEWKKNATALNVLLGRRGFDTAEGEKRFNQIRDAARSGKGSH